jgi:wyosine [tRNA(Phe)-imidazoG37] synthetase (radical SAM superfamily)
MNSIIYGPVSSWRLGRSLGIDLLSTKEKTCSFDCLYCQLGRTVHPLSERREFVSIKEVAAALEQVKGVTADYATFSGMGEPTLANNLGQAIQIARSILRLPIAVLTNSSLLLREDIRRELAQAEVVVAKIDAPTEEMFRRINRPHMRYGLEDILQAIKLFRMSYRGKLVLQMMFIEENRECAPEMARVAEELLPDEVQINTPLRPCGVKPLMPEEIAAIGYEFSALKRVVTVYEAFRPEVTPLSLKETLQRRPQL